MVAAVERLARLALVGVAVWWLAPHAAAFHDACDSMARYHLSSNQLMWRDDHGGQCADSRADCAGWARAGECATNPSFMAASCAASCGMCKDTLVDDYRQAYFWLRDHTPKDARVMAWWDYGYQISGMAKRTTLADGNTWNLEHIALLGLCLSSPEAQAHAIARHLADYVLVWKGGGSDDAGKAPHMARIANSVFGGHCAEGDCNGAPTQRLPPSTSPVRLAPCALHSTDYRAHI